MTPENWPTGPYNIIYADPPWQWQCYNNDTSTRWVGRHYPLMTPGEICSLPISALAADNCALFLWATFPTLPTAAQVIGLWGFTYKTTAFVWVKQNKDASLFMGQGYWTRSNAEVCLMATKGHPKRISASVFQIVMAPRGRHSAKPPEVRDRIVQLMGDLPRIELFAREKVNGWDCWGNEVPQ